MNNKRSGGGIMAGLIGLTAAAVGAYYLYGHENAKRHRKEVKSWMLKAKGEVLEELELAGEVTESAYKKAVNTVAHKYNELKNIDADELEAFINEMRDHWSGIKKTMQTRGRAVAKPKATKKPRNKTTKKLEIREE